MMQKHWKKREWNEISLSKSNWQARSLRSKRLNRSHRPAVLLMVSQRWSLPTQIIISYCIKTLRTDSILLFNKWKNKWNIGRDNCYCCFIVYLLVALIRNILIEKTTFCITFHFFSISLTLAICLWSVCFKSNSMRGAELELS